jgi:Uma2 family endonuclease
MSQLPIKSATETTTDSWVKASWEEYLQALTLAVYEKAKGYYHHGQMRLEMSPLGNPHSRDHLIIIHAVCLFASLRQLDFDGHDNCTYRKIGFQEAQPDVSFYLGNKAELIPWEATLIDLAVYPPPDLVIEVASASLADDKGEKRLLYESLGVGEYWIIDGQNVQVLAFAIAQGGSRRITTSQVLSGLDIELLEEAFRRSRQMNHGKVSAWLLSQWQD